MKKKKLYLNPNISDQHPIRSKTSFDSFFKSLKLLHGTQSEIKTRLIKNLLAFSEDFVADGSSASSENELMMDSVFAALSPITANEDDFFWALSTPVPNEVLYYTRAFEKFAESALKLAHRSAVSDESVNMRTEYSHYIYRVILEKCYHLSLAVNEVQYYALLNAETSLNQYFKIKVDTRFIDVFFDGDLPTLSIMDQSPDIVDDGPYKQLEQLLQIERFSLSGFTVITLHDATAEYTLELIKGVITSHGNESELFEQVTEHLKTLIGMKEIEFSMSPIIKLHGEYIINLTSGVKGTIAKASESHDDVASEIQNMIRQFELKPIPIFYSALKKFNSGNIPFIPELNNAGIRTFLLLPLFHKGVAVGALEVYAFKDIPQLESLITKLQLAAPLLGQLAKNSIDSFCNQINGVVRAHFTVLQPSVAWKFEQAASKYLLQKVIGTRRVQMETITFEHLYPLYGSIDIRNSTVLRNDALALDLTYAIQKAIEILKLINDHGETQTGDLIRECEQWIIVVSRTVNTEIEEQVSEFLNTQVKSFLVTVRPIVPVICAEQTDQYLAISKDDQEGQFYQHRNSLELCISDINMTVNSFFTQAESHLQALYPCYFESFRTDGLEYDIYVGQSIAPDKPFENHFVSLFLLWQLKTMIEVQQQVKELSCGLAYPLETTQLIYIRSEPLDITFRNDERHFDVEGVYNIRYEMIKKRIDKIKLKDSSERLTQPGKIAIVYSSSTEADSILIHIRELQNQHLLAAEIEFIELEHLNDVSGLKALRVSINDNFK